MSEYAIEVQDLVKVYDGVRVLDELSFHVAHGEVLGLLGPNGAGKTTAIHILATLVQPEGGDLTVMGYDVVEEPDGVRASIALTGQFAAVDPVLTGKENLVLFGRLRGLSRTDAVNRAEELLSRFTLDDAADQRVSTYSGGMMRRLDIAVSLVVPAPVLFLDEPTTGLDPRSRNELWDVVRELRDQGLTIILTTQYLQEADLLSERIVVIDNGRLVAEGSPAELKQAAGGHACNVTPEDPRRLDELANVLGEVGPASIDHDEGLVRISDAGSRQLAALVTAAAEADIPLADVSLHSPTLDDVFLHLTDDRAEAPLEEPKP